MKGLFQILLAVGMCYPSLILAQDDNYLTVRFNHHFLREEVINNPQKLSGSLDDFLNEEGKVEASKLNEQNIDLVKLKVTKLFRFFKTTDTVSISRTGDKVFIPPFWATFRVEVPTDYTLSRLMAILKQKYPLVIYVDPPFEVVLYDVPDDTLFSLQHSLNSSTYPNAHINLDSAWNIETGKKFIKVGVFDTGIDASHPDLEVLTGYNYNYFFINEEAPIADTTFGIDNAGHGTCVAGIIGAKRNNQIGIAGIAGGDGTDSTGVSLLDFGNGQFSQYLSADHLAAMIINASRSVGSYYSWTQPPPGLFYENDGFWDNASGFGIQLGNHSYGIAYSHEPAEEGNRELGDSSTFEPEVTVYYCNLCREAFLFSLQNGVTNVIARGNTTNSANISSSGGYPAEFDDSWTINVGASGTDGKRLHSAVNTAPGETWYTKIGRNMDLIAPGSRQIIATTRSTNLPDQSLGEYRNFNGTSASAPHVTGVAALLMSYYNKPCYSNINLDPADIEYILQKSARDVNPYVNGYDDSTGHGLLDAHKALKMIQFPEYQIVHPNEAPISTTLLEQDTINFYLKNPLYLPYNGPLGSQFTLQLERPYKVERRKYSLQYKIDSYMLPGTTLLDTWVRHSQTNSLGLVNDTIGQLEQIGQLFYWVRHVDTFKIEPMAHITNILNDSIVTLEGYYYHFIQKYEDSLGGATINENFWYPINPNIDSLQMAFSLYLHNPLAIDRFDFPCDSANVMLDTLLSVVENEDVSFQIYPNPGSNELFITLDKLSDNFEIELIDLYGKLISSKNFNANQSHVQLHLPDLKSGLYFVNLKQKGGVLATKKWIRL